MMVAAVDRSRLEAGDPITRVDALDEPQVGQDLERPVDRRDAHGPPSLTEPVEDLLGAQAAVLPAEQLDDGRPCAAPPVAGALEGFECIVRPGHGCSVSSAHDFENCSHSRTRWRAGQL